MEKKPRSPDPAALTTKAPRKRTRAGQKHHHKADDDNAANALVAAKEHQGRPETTTTNGLDIDWDDDEQVQACIDSKVAALQRLVPGGESLEVDQLLEETVDYIKVLRTRVQAMRAAAFLLEALMADNQGRMAGG